MKLLHTIFLTCFIINLSYTQTNKNVFFDQKAMIGKFHTIDELENLKKGELIRLYTARVNEIVTILPFLALTNEPNVKLSDIGIKENSDHLKTLNKHRESTLKTFENTKVLISDFIPYADTEKIIWTILYYEEVIKKIRIGANGNF
ncbi:hypothetical protein [Aquimarina algiphila]|uniref:Uncharacterized protein n=1 Tax=Aquimarina algiphila TaxID=2047982 RepID=A0A554VJS6_9FLAO|nr:hypothetical protein [Aquimarina algiphila]TSE08152.1 hypothetical protein FOF46_13180 [Aquimarina algiphila]